MCVCWCLQIVKNIPHGLPPFSANQWAPISRIDKLLPLAFIVMAVDMLESTSIARALARKNNYGACACMCCLCLLPLCALFAVSLLVCWLGVHTQQHTPNRPAVSQHL